ncbi:L-arabinose isomerase [Saccharicrinis fermentans]|uniref:L-arabinose isomerase n=1 Tax=Saccharicrinis fermentans DSM 9555 = JCM 21142 TaxID=869213 RepID=W7YKF9_9BACT|nr:L-arabinose isomerase [Saccharicrinis fermentans]GAF05011.1 L-arabinose isomerase [Saccharicrinis fermentans DSM 9555 = JCM 21142]
MKALNQLEVWFVTGSQHLYGQKTLDEVVEHSREIVTALNEASELPVKVICKATGTGSSEIHQMCKDANCAENCIGIITWMHTFSPAKMWIHGLKELNKPLLHLHTQYNKEIPWDDIDMDFMNLNQSAHGDREFGHMTARMRLNRKVVVGHWQDAKVLSQIARWTRVAAGWADSQDMLIIRFGDQMNNVAVTDGDKVEAERVFGYHVDYSPIAELVAVQNEVSDKEVSDLLKVYELHYDLADNCKEGGRDRKQVANAARIEIALRRFLEDKGAKAFTTNFDDLEGIDQLPGLACQRLMADGYGFGAEGDWKTAALCRTVWYMGQGLPNGCSFLEDYTLNFDGENSSILQAHMLEVCPLIANHKPKLEVHPLGIGGKNDPARLVFTSKTGPGVAVTVVDMGSRFRMIINAVDCIASKALPKLPVASALWIPQPNFEVGAKAWILAGGTHHTSFSYDLSVEDLLDFAEIAGVEALVIDKDTTISAFKKELQWNDLYYHLAKGI